MLHSNASAAVTTADDRPVGDSSNARAGASGGALAAGGAFAVLASACCVAPLVLVSLGIGGAWISNFTVLEPYRPYFLGAALIALALAWRRIYRPQAGCAPGEVCALPQKRRVYKILFWTVLVLVLAAFGFPYLAPLFY